MYLKIFEKGKKTIGKNEQLYCVNQKRATFKPYFNHIYNYI